MSVAVGDFVFIDPVAPAVDVRRGVARFVGETSFAEGPWVGVELVGSPGKNSGAVFDVQYFECLPLQGVFVRPELIRPYASAAVAPASTFDVQIRVELEESKETVATLTKLLEVKEMEVEELKLDKEILDEQRIAAETELEELRLNGGGDSNGSGGGLAEVVVALRIENGKLKKEIDSAIRDKHDLEEQISATNASDSIVESLTTRNLELDEELADTKIILEKILRERDNLQEVLSLQDEEIKQAHLEAEQLQADLDRLRQGSDDSSRDWVKQLEDERATVSRLDQQVFNLQQQIELGTAAKETNSLESEVSLSILRASLQTKIANFSESPINLSTTLFPVEGISRVIVAQVWACELRQVLRSVSSLLLTVQESLVRSLEELHHPRYSALVSSAADADGITIPSPLARYCATLCDALAALGMIEVDLASLQSLASLPQLSECIISVDQLKLFGSFGAMKELLYGIHRLLAVYETPGVNVKKLREKFRSLGTYLRTVRSGVVNITTPHESTSFTLSSRSIDLLGRLSKLAHVHEEGEGPSYRHATAAVGKLLGYLRSDAGSSIVSSSLQSTIALTWAYVTNTVLLVHCPEAALTHVQYLLQAAHPSTTDGDVRSTVLTIGVDGHGSSYLSRLTWDSISPIIMSLVGYDCMPAHLQPSDGPLPEQQLWDVVAERALHGVSVAAPVPDDLDVVSLANIMKNALKSVAPLVTAEEPQSVTAVSGSADSQALLEANADLRRELEQVKWSLWNATSENEALSFVKVDFKCIQEQLETQEAEHKANVRNITQEYDAGISVLLQKNAKVTSELRDAQRQNLQQVVSPMSLWERTQYQAAAQQAQSHLALAYGCSLRAPSIAPVVPCNKKTNIPSIQKPLSKVLSFTSKAERIAAREAILLPSLKLNS